MSFLEINLPQKQFFKIGDVSQFLGIPAHVLRHWEKEFKFLPFRKTKSRHRVYTKNDVEILGTIKHLLYVEKYTIDGAKTKLKKLNKNKKKVKDEDENIKTLLKRIESLENENKKMRQEITELNLNLIEKEREIQKLKALQKEREIILERIKKELGEFLELGA